MKKALLVLGVMAMFAFATACSKEKDCTCTTSTGGLTPDTTTDVHIKDGDCSDGDSSVSMGSYTATTTCKEK